MSHPPRPPIGSQSTVASRMMPAVCATGPSQVFPLPNSYGLVTPQPHPYMAHPQYMQSQQNMPSGVPMVIPGSIPGMYVPVAQMNPGIVPTNVDPAKLLEEQRRLEKERNFQLQQQRLKQFTVAGKKGSLNADNLIDNMFGKLPPKQTQKPQVNSSVKTLDFNTVVKPSMPLHEVSRMPQIQPKQEIQPTAPLKQEKIDKKELDVMMQECFNLSGPQKANKFSKPVVKELTPSAQQRFTFTSSNKSRDWKNLQGLDEVFVAKRPRFPEWCCKEHVPEQYKQIEALITSNGTHTPDTKLLFPVLLSSGLPQQSLGQIWELVNQSAPGQLTNEEMYAALALIAVTQAGHPVKTVDILHQLPACPIPQLQCFSNPTPPIPVESQPMNPSPPIPDDQKSQGLVATTDHSEPPTHQVLRPSAISLKDMKNLPLNSNVFQGSGFNSSPDDEFDDFKSATPTAVNFHMHTPSSDSIPGSDDFDDFKQAPISSFPVTKDPPIPSFPVTKQATISNFPVPKAAASSAAISKPFVVEQDLMSPEEDKYSVFRALQQNEVETEWGDFSVGASDFVSTNNANQEESSLNAETVVITDLQSNPTVLITQSNQIGGLFRTNYSSINPTKEEDEFGDFLAAEVSAPTVASVTSQLECLNTNFADFANFKEPEFHQVLPTGAQDNLQAADEFGDFASSLPPPTKPELGHEFLFHHLKDNVSLAESQSVSSLELGTFDGGGHSGDSKSSLSRQGSIPSLDLKNTYNEGADIEDFGEFQSQPVVNRASKSPSPAKDIKGSECNFSSNIPAPIPFQSARTVPLADKYSVIRLEERKEEDQHISCWIRCLQSSVNILQKTKKLFNQMSCSSVCNEVLRSEEGENYIKDVIEVFKVVRRIAVASKSAGKQTTPMLDLLNEAEQAWNTICGFFAGSNLMPGESSLEFSNAVLNSNSEDNTKACGLCLLNIEIRSKANSSEEKLKLSYGGRNYHSTCANLWVNCVDPLLPALTLPLLL